MTMRQQESSALPSGIHLYNEKHAYAVPAQAWKLIAAWQSALAFNLTPSKQPVCNMFKEDMCRPQNIRYALSISRPDRLPMPNHAWASVPTQPKSVRVRQLRLGTTQTRLSLPAPVLPSGHGPGLIPGPGTASRSAPGLYRVPTVYNRE
jgi:hypothetical protein